MAIMESKINPSDEYKIRLVRLEKIKAAKINPYPSQTEQGSKIGDLLENFEKLAESLKPQKASGRIRAIRSHGGSCFANVEDGTAKIQIYLKKDELSGQDYDFFSNNLDVGDFIQATGTLFNTKKGEKTLLVKNLKFLSKSLLPLPEKWHGLKDVEIRFRQRYLDLLANPEVKAIFIKRSQIIQFIRNYLIKDGFLEVETPTLQTVASGAIAKPFKTHHNALNADLFLRIAPELYLKELVIGGLDQVFEIARCFRNEGIDYAHNPEFTQVELYWAYRDYNYLMDYTEKLLADLVKTVGRSLTLEYNNQSINWQPPYPRIDFRQALIDSIGIDLDKYDDESLNNEAQKKGMKTEKFWGKGKIADELFKNFIRPKLINPTYIINHPIELSPLAKRIIDRPNYVERFQLIVAGKIELLNAFSELNDPLEQEERFKFQQALAKQGDDEAMKKDDEFIEALKYGLPPTAGLGLGIDRLANLLTNTANIREVILFPILKPENTD